MEPKLHIIRKKKSEAERAHLDPLMRALKHNGCRPPKRRRV